jgi:hypothetical protein
LGTCKERERSERCERNRQQHAGLLSSNVGGRRHAGSDAEIPQSEAQQGKTHNEYARGRQWFPCQAVRQHAGIRERKAVKHGRENQHPTADAMRHIGY